MDVDDEVDKPVEATKTSKVTKEKSSDVESDDSDDESAGSVSSSSSASSEEDNSDNERPAKRVSNATAPEFEKVRTKSWRLFVLPDFPLNTCTFCITDITMGITFLGAMPNANIK